MAKKYVEIIANATKSFLTKNLSIITLRRLDKT